MLFDTGVRGLQRLGGRQKDEHGAKLGHAHELTYRSMRKIKWVPTLISLICSTQSQAQTGCGADSTLLGVAITTDAWGYEMYWELSGFDGECGDGMSLAWGGNADAACGEGVDGLQSEAGVYESNAVIELGAFCVASADSLVLIHRDNYGDGGTQFLLTFDGVESLQFQGTGSGNDWAFLPALAAGDAPCVAEVIDTSIVASISGLTVSPGEPAPPALGCGTYGGWCESGLSNTLWLAWEVPADGGVYEISTCNEATTFDTQLALWNAVDCADFSSFSLMNANDDAGCGLGAYRSTILTPCLVGGETLYLQVDGYYGEVGDVEVSIQPVPEDSWDVSVNVNDLSCSLQQSFNPDGSIQTNTNVGAASVDWSWSGPFGFVSDESLLAPLLPGTYVLEASFCGQTFEAEYVVNEPDPLSFEVFLAPDCAGGAMVAELGWAGETDGVNVSWTSSGEVTEGFEVSDLPEGLCEVEVTDANGCVSSDLFWVEAVGVPDVDLGPDLFGCAGDAFTLLAPLQGNLTYEWTTGQAGALLILNTEEPGTLVVGVEVTDGAGCSETDAVIVTLDDCTSSVDDLGLEKPFHAYPNPCAGEVTVSMKGSTPQMVDARGQSVTCNWSETAGGYTTDLSNLPDGLYLLHSTEGQEVVRLVKQGPR